MNTPNPVPVVEACIWVVLLARVPFRILFYKGAVVYLGSKKGPYFRKLYYIYIYICYPPPPPEPTDFMIFRHNPVKYCSASTLRRHQAARTQEACTLARTPTLGSRTTGISGSCHGTGISLSLLLVKMCNIPCS